MKCCAICGSKATGTAGSSDMEISACAECAEVTCDWFVEWLP